MEIPWSPHLLGFSGQEMSKSRVSIPSCLVISYPSTDHGQLCLNMLELSWAINWGTNKSSWCLLYCTSHTATLCFLEERKIHFTNRKPLYWSLGKCIITTTEIQYYNPWLSPQQMTNHISHSDIPWMASLDQLCLEQHDLSCWITFLNIHRNLECLRNSTLDE